VPIVEPEVLMDGSHTIERCEEVTGSILHAVFNSLCDQLHKPNMVIAGKECTRHVSVEEVTTATLRCLRRHVPVAVPGIVFLSGGQSALLATAHLNAINRLPGSKPWKVSFSYGRAFRIRRWRRGMARTRTWLPASALFTNAPAPTGRRVSGNIPMKWRRHRSALMTRRIVATGETTDLQVLRRRNAQCDGTGFKGGNDGERAV
jgi:fructose-bisphosphate aldolase class I